MNTSDSTQDNICLCLFIKQMSQTKPKFRLDDCKQAILKYNNVFVNKPMSIRLDFYIYI